MYKKLDEIVDYINNQKYWNKNEKMRYAYLSLGKIITKDVEFFFSLFNKMGKDNYTSKQLQNINDTTEYTSKVICKSSAEMLKYIFDRTGIESSIIKTTEKNLYRDDTKKLTKYEDGMELPNPDEYFIVQHYFVCAKGEEDKSYFLTINADIPNIKCGMQTEHFGNSITYKSPEGNIMYEGEEINYSTFSLSELEQMDSTVGYLNLMYEDKCIYTSEMLKLLENVCKANKYYKYLLSSDITNKFYEGLCEKINILDEENYEPNFGAINVNYTHIEKEKWNSVYEYLCVNAIKLIYRSYGIVLPNDVLNDVFSSFEENDYYEGLNKIDKYFKESKFKQIANNVSPYIIISKTRNYMKAIERFINSNAKDMATVQKNRKELSEKLTELSVLYVNPKYLESTNGKYSSEYLATKIRLIFQQVFSLGEENTMMTNLEISEQAAIIKKILGVTFKEVTPDRVNLNYDEKLSAIENRIVLSALKRKNREGYDYLLFIKNAKYSADIILVYELDKNILRGATPNDLISLDYITNNYNVITSRIDLDIENIEKNGNRKK